MLRRESKTGVRSWKETRRINALKKKKKTKSTKTKKTAAAAGGARRNPARSGPVEYGELPTGTFMSMVESNMSEEDKQRLAAMLAEDESCASASIDDDSASEVCCLFRRIFGSSVRACCANEMMPAQASSQESEDYDSDKSDKSVATLVGAASVDSEPLGTRRPAKKVAK